MDPNLPPEKLSWAIAEEVLRTVYGDDLTGCPVSLASIGTIIEEGLNQRVSEDKDLLEIYEKLAEAVHLLSTPPDPASVNNAEELRRLLGERLDAIQVLTKKTIQAISRVKASRAGDAQTE